MASTISWKETAPRDRPGLPADRQAGSAAGCADASAASRTEFSNAATARAFRGLQGYVRSTRVDLADSSGGAQSRAGHVQVLRVVVRRGHFLGARDQHAHPVEVGVRGRLNDRRTAGTRRLRVGREHGQRRARGRMSRSLRLGCAPTAGAAPALDPRGRHDRTRHDRLRHLPHRVLGRAGMVCSPGPGVPRLRRPPASAGPQPRPWGPTPAVRIVRDVAAVPARCVA